LDDLWRSRERCAPVPRCHLYAHRILCRSRVARLPWYTDSLAGRLAVERAAAPAGPDARAGQVSALAGARTLASTGFGHRTSDWRSILRESHQAIRRPSARHRCSPLWTGSTDWAPRLLASGPGGAPPVHWVVRSCSPLPGSVIVQGHPRQAAATSAGVRRSVQPAWWCSADVDRFLRPQRESDKYRVTPE